MIKKVLSGLICASVIVAGSIYCDAGSKSKGTCAENFLKLGVGARAIGMGEAFTAVASDANAIYWNPAGLANLNRRQINAMHNTWLVETYYDHLSFAAPFKQGGMCAGITYLGSGDIPKYPKGDGVTAPPQDGNFTAYDMALIGGYGWKFSDKVLVGVSGKLIQSKIDSYDAKGVAVDLGILSQTPVENLTVGGTIQNMGSKIKFNKDGDSLPLMVKVGAAYTMLDNNLTTAMDITKARDNDVKFNVGGEYLIAKSFAVRAGYSSKIDEGAGITAGIGYKHPVVTVDYAYVPWGDLEKDTHRVSLLFNLW
ncbi:MAG: PorV/PorQ family protein [Candidatus Desantisbacteria bacterium]